MDEILVKLIYHHEGKFIKGKYEGGEVTIVDEEFDVDLLSYPNLLSYVLELGYPHIGGLYYRCGTSGSFIILIDDVIMLSLGKKLKHKDELYLFIDHTLNNDTILDEIFQKQHFVQVGSRGQLPNL